MPSAKLICLATIEHTGTNSLIKYFRDNGIMVAPEGYKRSLQARLPELRNTDAEVVHLHWHELLPSTVRHLKERAVITILRRPEELAVSCTRFALRAAERARQLHDRTRVP